MKSRNFRLRDREILRYGKCCIEVLYVNGIAIGVLELKCSRISIGDGNHEYVGEEAQVAEVITRWIQTEVEGH